MPKANGHIDLSARWARSGYLFEMESTTEDNPHAQIRRGLSKLYEYRYIQNADGAKSVVVSENLLPRKLGWIDQCLVAGRGSAWPGMAAGGSIARLRLGSSLRFRAGVGVGWWRSTMTKKPAGRRNLAGLSGE